MQTLVAARPIKCKCTIHYTLWPLQVTSSQLRNQGSKQDWNVTRKGPAFYQHTTWCNNSGIKWNFTLEFSRRGTQEGIDLEPIKGFLAWKTSQCDF